MPSWGELLAGKTGDQVFDEIIAGLRGLTPPWPVSDWSPGAPSRTMLKRGVGPVTSRVYGAITDIAKGGHLRLAQVLAEAQGEAEWARNSDKSWLVALAYHRYGIVPHAQVFTEGLFRFTAAANAGPYPIAPGQFWISADGGLRFNNNNAAALTLAKGGQLDVPFIAESPGEAYNLAVGQINTALGRGSLNVSLPGVTVENVAQPNGTWITVYGTLKETPKELADRCAARMGAIGQDGGTGAVTAPPDMLIYRAKQASPQVKKVSVFTNYFQGKAQPGAVTLFLAGDSGPVNAAVVKAVYDALYPYRAPNGQLYVASCVGVTLKPEGVVWVASDNVGPRALADAATNLVAYQRRAEIGGTILAAQVIEEIMNPAGVVDFKPSRLFDVRLARNQVAIFDVSGLAYDTLPAR